MFKVGDVVTITTNRFYPFHNKTGKIVEITDLPDDPTYYRVEFEGKINTRAHGIGLNPFPFKEGEFCLVQTKLPDWRI